MELGPLVCPLDDEFEFIGVLRNINDISVIYVKEHMCRRTEEEVVPTVGHPTP